MCKPLPEKIFIILLNWNNWKTTLDCYKSINDCHDSRITTLIVDNNSSDQSLVKLRAVCATENLIENSENSGFSIGCNIGILEALSRGASHVLLLNNDAVVKKGFMDDALNEMNSDLNIYAVTGKILTDDLKRTIWQAGGHIDFFRIQGIARGFGETDCGQYDKIENTKWASGAFTIFKRECFIELGLLPEQYFFGQEEWDFSTQIIRANKTIRYVPTFLCIHRAGDSYSRNHPILLVYGNYLNKNIFAKKYLSPIRYYIWRQLFSLYVKFIWPRRAKTYANDVYTTQDYLASANLALRHFSSISRVTRKTLEEAGQSLKINTNWKS